MSAYRKDPEKWKQAKAKAAAAAAEGGAGKKKRRRQSFGGGGKKKQHYTPAQWKRMIGYAVEVGGLLGGCVYGTVCVHCLLNPNPSNPPQPQPRRCG